MTNQRPANGKRCAIYTRKSTARGLEQEFNTLEAQREACARYVAALAHEGWRVVPQRYDDGGYSGATMERPAFRALMQDVDAGRIDVVVVYKLDRLSRSLLDFAEVIRRFEAKGVAFVSVTQNFSTADAMGRLTLNMLMSFAEFEREMIAERTRDKIHAARRKGKHVGGIPPLGYDLRDGKLVVNDDEVALVQAVFGVYAEQRSLLGTARTLNDRGARTKEWVSRSGKLFGGNRWDKSSVYRTLTNVVYVGKVSLHGEVYDGEQDGIVDAGIFERTQKLLTRGDPVLGRSRRYDYYLRGLLRCTVCGSYMTPTSTKRPQREYRYYVCTAVNKRGKEACTVRSVPAEAIEQLVVDQVRGIAKDAALLERVVESMTQQRRTKLPALRGERDQVTREHAACVQKSRRVLDVLGDGDAGRSQLAAEHLSELEARARELEDRVAELDVAIAAVEATTVSRDEVAQAMALWEPVWDVLVDRERARILALLLERVEYDGTQVALSFYPLGMAHLAAEAATMADGGDGEGRDEAATMADSDEGLEEGEEAAA